MNRWASFVLCCFLVIFLGCSHSALIYVPHGQGVEISWQHSFRDITGKPMAIIGFEISLNNVVVAQVKENQCWYYIKPDTIGTCVVGIRAIGHNGLESVWHYSTDLTAKPGPWKIVALPEGVEIYE